jgi:ABC-type Fe3+ transport system permease subunit
MKKSATPLHKRIVCTLLLAFAFASYLAFRVDGEKTRHRHHQRRAHREADANPQRIKHAFQWTGALLFIALAPLLIRFIHVLMSDPIVPLLWKELKVRGRRFVSEKFGSIGDDRWDEEVENDKTKNGGEHVHAD